MYASGIYAARVLTMTSFLGFSLLEALGRLSFSLSQEGRKGDKQKCRDNETQQGWHCGMCLALSSTLVLTFQTDYLILLPCLLVSRYCYLGSLLHLTICAATFMPRTNYDAVTSTRHEKKTSS